MKCEMSIARNMWLAAMNGETHSITAQRQRVGRKRISARVKYRIKEKAARIKMRK